ncbi:unnamed protein product [Bursaphelenchus xylophilus]|uniref:(pine wood nematode) hypothetical protein n=1 Tax=Bursaphelenchus xylophilus TaxID=6326 RepID=A0A1I7RNJ5_BURXY|nr:unnamed protein product [Bursaphelenchus xylophilus]CAG9124087.1 unnamed protein product [Bursaphelenchus xylophilus]
MLQSLGALVLLALITTTVLAREQSVAASGKLMCGASPAINVRVSLYDIDIAPDPDDLLDETFTDIDGKFMVQGSTSEETDIEPILKITHDCEDDNRNSQGSRIVTFQIPYSYVTLRGVPNKQFELGTVNLETRFHNEERQVPSAKIRRHHFYPRRLNYDNEFDIFDGF